MQTPLTAIALARLPEREAQYAICCQRLTDAEKTGRAGRVLIAQQVLGFALASLNTTRAGAGLSPVAGPRPRSLDELLALAEASTAQAA